MLTNPRIKSKREVADDWSISEQNFYFVCNDKGRVVEARLCYEMPPFIANGDLTKCFDRDLAVEAKQCKYPLNLRTYSNKK